MNDFILESMANAILTGPHCFGKRVVPLARLGDKDTQVGGAHRAGSSDVTLLRVVREPMLDSTMRTVDRVPKNHV